MARQEMLNCFNSISPSTEVDEQKTFFLKDTKRALTLKINLKKKCQFSEEIYIQATSKQIHKE